jgi:hypothetical protein
MPGMTRNQKITLGEMRSSGVRGLLVYCSDYRCCHSVEMIADHWADEADEVRSDIEPRFVCSICGRMGADVRSHPDWGKKSVGY